MEFQASMQQLMEALHQLKKMGSLVMIDPGKVGEERSIHDWERFLNDHQQAMDKCFEMANILSEQVKFEMGPLSSLVQIPELLKFTIEKQKQVQFHEDLEQLKSEVFQLVARDDDSREKLRSFRNSIVHQVDLHKERSPDGESKQMMESWRDVLALAGKKELNDQEWSVYRDRVESKFDKGFCVAVERGKVFLEKAPLAPPPPEPGKPSEGQPSVETYGSEEMEPEGGGSEEPFPESDGSSKPLPVEKPEESIPSTVEPEPSEDQKVTAGSESATPSSFSAGISESEVAEEEKPSEVNATEEHSDQPVGIDISEGIPFSSGDSNETEKPAEEPVSVPPKEEMDPDVRFAWELVVQNKIDLAYEVFRILQDRDPEKGSLKRASGLLELLLLSRHLKKSYSLVAKRMLQTLQSFLLDFPDVRQLERAEKLLMVSALLYPCLVSPNTSNPALLKQLQDSFGIPDLQALVDLVADFGARGLAISPGDLQSVHGQERLVSERETLQKRVDQWIEESQRVNWRFPPAGKAWNQWMSKGGFLFQLKTLLASSEPSEKSLEEVSDLIQLLSDSKRVERELKRTLSQDFHTNFTISAKTMTQFFRHLSDAVSLAQDWHKWHCLKREQEVRGYQPVLKLGQALEPLIERVSHFLEEQPEREKGIRTQAALCQLRGSLEQINTLFDARDEGFQNELDPELVLHQARLRTKLNLDPFFEFETYETLMPGAKFQAFQETAIREKEQEPEQKWLEALHLRRVKREFKMAFSILQVLDQGKFDAHSLKELRKDVEDYKVRSTNQLKDSIDAASTAVENAFARGILEENKRQEFAGKLAALERPLGLGEEVSFGKTQFVLEKIHYFIQSQAKKKLQELRGQIQDSGVLEMHGPSKELETALQNQDVFLAREIFVNLKEGRAVSGILEESSFLSDFFPQKAIQMENELSNLQKYPQTGYLRHSLIQSIRDRRIDLVDMRRTTGAQAREAAEMIDNWLQVKKLQYADQEKIQKILEGIGFNVREVHREDRNGRSWIALKAEPIQNRRICPVPSFGSEAQGRYKVLCLWERPTEDEIVTSVVDYPNSPVLVLYFGRLSVVRRRELARTCFEEKKTFLVIDETLLFFLCGERGSRLPAMFRCTLPFSYNQPYQITSSHVPPEMFYGRQNERESILDPLGSCFIYGGRQLGKTALLRDVQRSFHNQEEGRICQWIDLKAIGIGSHRPASELLPELFSVLEQHGVVSGVYNGDSELSHQVENWVKQTPERRVLLLLDEADRFLEKDSKNDFRVSSFLKGIMDQTNRRFKIVFAGLHNVLRSTKHANHPLAHYGTPLCIGPLLSNGEVSEARKLVRYPLMSIGYKISENLATKILAQTNYYPSLIQVYGHHLLRHVSDPSQRFFDFSNSPPYELGREHLDAAFQGTDLRKQIRDRFMWTLDLDPRYRMIALLVTLEIYQRGTKSIGTEEDFSVREIQHLVSEWYPKVFSQGMDYDGLRVLLDELVGLGVLRESRQGYYTLRSPNLIPLLGTADEIENQVLSMGDEEPRTKRAEYEPASFRQRLDGGKVFPRSSLTVAQESRLHGEEIRLAVFFGSRWAAINGLERSLDLLSPQEHSLVRVESPESWGLLLEKVRNSQSVPNEEVFFIPPEVPWDRYWLEMVEALPARNGNGQVMFVFAADSQKTQALLAEDNGFFDWVESHSENVFRLGPWSDSFLNQWLEEVEIGTHDTFKRLQQETGKWPLILETFFQAQSMEILGLDASLQKSDFFQNPELKQEMGKMFVSDGGNFRDFFEGIEEFPDLRDLANILDMTPEKVLDLQRWAWLMSLITKAGNDGQFVVDPVASRFFQAGKE